jgi:hypothetical protein
LPQPPAQTTAMTFDHQRQAERLGQIHCGQGDLDRPGGDDSTLTHQQHVGERGRDLLHVMGHQHQRGRFDISGQQTQTRHQVLAASEVEPGGRLVEQHEFGVGHQRPGDLHPLALALAESAERPVAQVRRTQGLEQVFGTCVVQRFVLLPPAPHDPVGSGDDDVVDQLVRGQPFGDCCAGKADSRAQLEDVDRAKDLAENPCDTRRGVDPASSQLQQGGLSGPVGPQDDPALAFLDLPRDVVEQRVASTDHADAGEFEDVAHGP